MKNISILFLSFFIVSKVYSQGIKKNFNEMTEFEKTKLVDTEPLANVNEIVDSNDLGVFYAENELALLENYKVSNTYKSLENFYYQFTIEVGNNFNIPTNKNAKVESVKEIIIKPGFFAESGSSFLAKIDNSSILKSSIRNDKILETNTNLFDETDDIKNSYIYDYESIDEPFALRLYPNPFRDRIIIHSEKIMSSGSILIYNILGNLVISKDFKNKDYLEINDLKNLSNGIYFLRILSENKIILNSKILKH